jgi:uncharacterized protein YgiM (DUF1202 family)
MRVSVAAKIIAGGLLAAGLFLVPGTCAQAETTNSIIGGGGVAGVTGITDLTEDELIAMAEESEGSFYGYTNIGICNVEEGNLNVRAAGTSDASMLGKLPRNAACEIHYIDENGWAQITSGEVNGWVNSEYLLMGAEARVKAHELVRTVALVQTNGLNVREEPSTDSAILTQMLKGQELEFVQYVDNGWIEVTIDADTCYVAGEYVEVTEMLDVAVTMKELLYGQGISDTRVAICEYAKQFVGNPYVWGGTSLTKGCDCSGFVMVIFKKWGYSLSHSSRAQANEGTKIKFSEIKPGDLIFYGNSRGTINHVGIYLGNGQVISASSPKTGIRISPYNYRTPLKYVRVIKD